MTPQELRLGIKNATEQSGTSTEDNFEVHTLSNTEPDIECIHLTERAIDAILDLFISALPAPINGSKLNSHPTSTGWNSYYRNIKSTYEQAKKESGNE